MRSANYTFEENSTEKIFNQGPINNREIEKKRVPENRKQIQGKRLVGILTFILGRGVHRGGGVRWRTFDQLLWNVCFSRSSDASGMKKEKRHTYRVSRRDKCRVVTFRM